MNISKLKNEELYTLLKMGDLLTTKYFRESGFNKQSEKEYLAIGEIMNKLYNEANKRLKNIE